MIFYIIIALIVFIIIYSLYLYNKFVKLNNKVREAFSTMDVYLKKRWDLIPNLVEVVKGYAKHEENTFEEVAKLRGSSYDDLSTKEKLNTNEEHKLIEAKTGKKMGPDYRFHIDGIPIDKDHIMTMEQVDKKLDKFATSTPRSLLKQFLIEEKNKSYNMFIDFYKTS